MSVTVTSLNVLAGVAAALIVAASLAGANRASPGRARGVRRLGWTRGMIVGAALSFPLGLGITWMAAQARADQQFIAALVAGGFLLGSAYINASIHLYKVWWTNEAIYAKLGFFPVRRLPWADVRGWTFRPHLQVFIAEGSGRSIWFSPMHTGHRDLLRRIERIAPTPDADWTTAADGD